MRMVAPALWLVVLAACSTGVPRPAALDIRNDSCGTCRMTVSSPRFASQVVAPGEEPVFFDDLGCLAKYLASHGALPEGWTAFVADHRTGEWVKAQGAVYTRVDTLETPMGSHLVAHASASSRDLDDRVPAGRPESVATVLPQLGPGGAR